MTGNGGGGYSSGGYNNSGGVKVGWMTEEEEDDGALKENIELWETVSPTAMTTAHLQHKRHGGGGRSLHEMSA